MVKYLFESAARSTDAKNEQFLAEGEVFESFSKNENLN